MANNGLGSYANEPKFRQLRADEIEVRIMQVGQWGVQCALYKNARTDMDILDEAVGVLGWSCDYQEVKGNLYCGVTIGGVRKEDCGIESRDDGSGNKKKGEASDAFKRACVKWGIGRALYGKHMKINIDLPRDPDGPGDKAKWKLRKTSTTLSVSSVKYDESGEISELVIVEDRTNKAVYCYPKGLVPIEKVVEERVNVPVKETETQKKYIFSIAANKGIPEDSMRMKIEGWHEDKHRKFKNFDEFTHEDIVEIKVNLTKVMEYAR